MLLYCLFKLTSLVKSNVPTRTTNWSDVFRSKAHFATLTMVSMEILSTNSRGGGGGDKLFAVFLSSRWDLFHQQNVATHFN